MKHCIWLAPLALAACGKQAQVSADNASIAEVANQMQESGASKTTLRPGLWSIAIKVDNISAPGVPPQVEQEMRKGIGQSKTMTDCLTEETARKPFDRFVHGIKDDCRYDHFEMGGGKIDSKLVCTKDGLQRATTLQGTYAPEQYKMQMMTEALGQGQVKRINMTMTMDAKRVGDCPKRG